MRMCCLDCDFTNSTMKLQKEINPKDDRRQMRVKVVLGIFAVFLLLGKNLTVRFAQERIIESDYVTVYF